MNIEQKVQALLTAANTATGEADETLTDAVESLIDGYGGGVNPLLYAVGTMPSFYNKTLPNNFELTLGSGITKLSTGYSMGFANSKVSSTSSPSKLKITAQGTITDMTRMFDNMKYGFREIELNFSTASVTTFTSCFVNMFDTKTITNPLDLSSATAVTKMFEGSYGLENLAFVPDTTKLSISLSACKALTDASIISIANGLSESVTSKTLTLHATPKGKCDTILGTVALDGTGTYHVFTADAAGTVTLTDFITTVKGWTMA